MSIFIPKQINVGFQNRDGTYTGKLAYVIYWDSKGTLRKEKSWQDWRDKKIDPEKFDNTPLEGFVLNKKAGGYSTGWNHRQTYCRVYDPRGFEFEIDIPNLLYILENTDSIKGKGLVGEFVYGWDGKELLLIPTSSPDYDEIMNFSSKMNTGNWLKGKDLHLGGIYLTNKDEEWVYLGRFEKFCDNSWNRKTRLGESQGNHYFFWSKYDKPNWRKETGKFIAIKSLTRRVISTVSNDPVHNYAELMDELEHRQIYSPLDTRVSKYIPLTIENYSKIVDTPYWHEVDKFVELAESKGVYRLVHLYLNNGKQCRVDYRMHQDYQIIRRIFGYYKWYNFADLVKLANFYIKDRYLANGKLMKG